MKVTRKIHYMWKVWEMLPKNIKKTLLGFLVDSECSIGI